MKQRVTPARHALLLALACLAEPGLARGQSAPQITDILTSPEAITLMWTSAGVGQAYSVQSRDSLTDGLWLTRSDLRPWPIALTQWAHDRADPRPMGFYRVIAVPTAERGKVLSAGLINTLDTGTISSLLRAAGSTNIQPKYRVDVVKMVYETLDPLGGRTQASGVLALPQNPDRAPPLVSYQHGTLVLDSEAPSAYAFGERVIGIAFATTGYAALVPDYLGLGDSPGLHPYHHARSEATACVDFLRAARTWCATNTVSLTDQLFLCGYSEGGHVTMALHRELELYHADEFTVTASAPMAGAYDLSGTTLEDAVSGRPMPNPYYFGLLLAAYQDVYHLANSLGELLASPYDSALPPLLTGTNNSRQINAAMPSIVTNLLKPEVVWSLQNDPEYPLRVALRDNDLYRWTPAAPMRLYHCGGDQDVIFANSQVAYDSFQSRGATQVELIEPLPGGDHGDCTLPSLEWAKAWFDSLQP